MKSRLKQILTMAVPLLLPLILGVFFFGFMPGYNTLEKREAYLQEQCPGAEIIYESVIEEKYMVCHIRSESTLGFGLFQKTLGKWKFDDLALSEEDTAVGDFYLNDDHYYVVVTNRKNVDHAILSFTEAPTGKELPQQTVPVEGDGFFIAMTDLEGTLTDIIFRDADGNEI